jgi:hypothetical protein
MKKPLLFLTIFICVYSAIYCEDNEKPKQLSTSVLPEFSIVSYPGCDSNYIFLATTSSSAPYIMIIDNNGTLVFAQKTIGGVYDFKPQPNGVLSYYDIAMDGFYILDADCNLIDSIRCLNGIETDIHELRILPNGNYLILGFDTHKVDMSQIVAGGRTSATIIGYVLQEIDKDKNVIFEWKTWDHLDITDSYTDLTQGTIDVAHGNSIDVDFDGNFLVSLRNTQEIVKINRVTGEIIWRLGGKKNQFEFINDTLGFSWQHAARRLPNGNIMLFDNGYRREPSVMSFSRALEYKIDENNKTAALVWQYRNTPDIYSIGLGYSQRLPGGNTLIAWGGVGGAGETGKPVLAITEVTNSGKMVFELSFQQSYSTYRAYRYPWKPEHITKGNYISSTVEDCKLSVNKNDDTASVRIGLINTNPFPVVITSITNNQRAFYIPYEFPAEINANDSLIFRVYFKPGLGGSFSDTLKIYTNYNEISMPLSGEKTTDVMENDLYKNAGFSLAQNYPNPFNPECLIEYNVASKSFVNITVYDILGRKVAGLVNAEKVAGNYTVRFSGRSDAGAPLASGVYFYSLNVNGFVISKKMILEK